jgi:hypothetical protein
MNRAQETTGPIADGAACQDAPTRGIAEAVRVMDRTVAVP